ncbi:MAG: hypothetical protein P8R38_04015, partial [Planctomycetota bacterium]|nr:hypothetical protein [Planctomycetota bacterium]
MRAKLNNYRFLFSLLFAGFVSFCLPVGSLTLEAQQFSNNAEGIESFRSPATGKIHLVSGAGGKGLPLPEGVEPDLSDPLQALRFHGQQFGINFPEVQLKKIRTEKCSLGQIHHTFHQ